MQPRLIVHGGAWDIPDEHVDAHVVGVRSSVEQVWPDLKDGMSALEAVERAVNALELDPTFDAGRGSFLNAEGDIEMDALIMDGARFDFGAVAGVKNIMHPVSLARRVMNEKDFRILISDGAMKFARACGFAELDPRELLTERELEFYEKIKADGSFSIKGAFGGAFGNTDNGQLKKPSDTVGAVALDARGNLACATSTGGTPRKHPGRVGDSPVIGCGGYADNLLGAASATGYGETILRVMLCRTACDAMAHGGAMHGAAHAITVLADRADGLGGVIAISPDGEYGFAHNTPRMAYAYADGDEVRAYIKMDE